MRIRKRVKVNELAELFDQHRNTISQELKDQRIDLREIQHVFAYIVQKSHENAQWQGQVASLVKSN